MEVTKNKKQTDIQSYEGQSNSLIFFEKILNCRCEPEEKRRQVLEYCSSFSIQERSMWKKLALFREAGATDKLFKEEEFNYFEDTDEQIREQILILIKKLPLKTIKDFRELVSFTERFLDRVKFLCDALLHFFLEKEKGAYRETWDMSLYTDFFEHKMFRELDFIHGLINMYSFHEVNKKYGAWLWDKVLDEEVLI